MSHDGDQGEIDDDVVVLDFEARADGEGDGVRWTLDPVDQLNANLVHFGPGGGVGRHVNDEVEVLVVVVAGGGAVEFVARTVDLSPGTIVRIPRSVQREIRAGVDGLTYLTVHRRRHGPTIGSRS